MTLSTIDPAMTVMKTSRILPFAERRVQRVRFELVRREVRVASVGRPSPNLVAVTFADASLNSFASESFDDHVKLMIPVIDGAYVMRDYTPRRFDRAAGTLTIEFALHDHGPATDWARQAAPGQRVLVGGPRGSMVVPTDYDWHLLAGDETALPAIRRRLEELPAASRVIVRAQVADAADRRAPAGAAAPDLQWVGDGDALVGALRELALPPGEGFVWCAGEASVMARVRDVLLVEKQHPREALKVAAYWKRGAADYHARLEG